MGWNSEAQLLDQREKLRVKILELVDAAGELTDEAMNAVDIVMDVASTFEWGEKDKMSPRLVLAREWNDWTFNECAAAATRQLDEGTDGSN